MAFWLLPLSLCFCLVHLTDPIDRIYFSGRAPRRSSPIEASEASDAIVTASRADVTIIAITRIRSTRHPRRRHQVSHARNA
jgi:hypothetical protein